MSQPIETTGVRNTEILKSKLTILPDRNYSIENLSRDTNLFFSPLPDSLAVGKIYWLKITVENPYPTHRNYVLKISPQLNNTLYYFSPDQQKWLTSRTDAVNNTGSRLLGRHWVSFIGKSSTNVFVKIDLTGFGYSDRKVKVGVGFQPEVLAAKHEQHILISWVCCMIVLLVFLLNNLYIYLCFRDKAVLYYVIAQVGGMIYLTGYRWISHQFLPAHVFSIHVNKSITCYDLTQIMEHLAIVITLYWYIKLTRTFLNTRQHLPRIDNILRSSISIYTVLTVVVMAVNIAGYNLDYYTLPYDNVFCGLLILQILATGIIAYLRKLPFAVTFLLSNGFSLLLMVAIPLSHLIISLQNEENLWIPELVVLTQTLALSIALVARTRTIQSALSVAEMDNKQLEFNLMEADYLVQLNRLEIDKMNSDIHSEKIKNELLQERLETNQRELASSTLYMVQKNELLSHLKSQIQILSRPNPSTSQGLKEMSSLIDSNTQLDTDWKKFKMHFEQVHPHFFEELKAKHPQLTMKETRLYAYFHMNLSHKEIAALLIIDPASVRRAKTRLFKKMAIPETE